MENSYLKRQAVLLGSSDQEKGVYLCLHAAAEIIFDSFYLPKNLVDWSFFQQWKKGVTFPKCYHQKFQPQKVIMESPRLSSQTPNCMLTEDRAMILEGLANCPENTPVTLVLRVRQTDEVGDFRANYRLQPKSFWTFLFKDQKDSTWNKEAP